jgi:hypothetical protein
MSKKKELTIGYHGNSLHLNEFEPHIKIALEEFYKIAPIKLLCIHDMKTKWKQGKPEIPITEIKYDIATFEDNLLNCDIGIIPGVYESGSTDSDYIIKFKNKSNSGRCFVFHQLKIPVVGGFIPSNFHILGDENCGYLAHKKDGWLNALKELTCENRRQLISDNAFNKFNELYNPVNYTKKLIEFINKLSKK